ncbi:hypothetical protein [Aquisalinus flavus]|uniref:Endo-acting ulvan lyase C-terminal domain-containing protein n=1 Tax=Aquisalinus flavus TaxID=1526572 RepID=A0A8J2V3E8_9PROT|nr:hypothetical protein [Aquisalinus flavus]MBD0425949.1 hypothetical protein [Aquisalinus flavus]UNE48458.1 hypothetical protein FF099_10560 [Aquisalinus flavus]GGD11937.1 hypothetical protein GCM10011342_20940 [Aquisalinus flavus]
MIWVSSSDRASNVDGRDLVQCIIAQEAGETYTHEDLPVEFLGRFAVLTLSGSGEIEEAYIGDGQALRFGDFLLEPAGSGTPAFWTARRRVRSCEVPRNEEAFFQTK